MAEFVQLRLEEMRPELEQYVKFQLFKPEDIRNITIQRKELEYKIHKHSKSKDDYLKYIQYEVDLLKLLRLKLEFFKIEENGSRVKKELCRFVINRVMSLFFYAVSRFPEDIKLWLSYIKFCKVERRLPEVSKNLERMLKYHGNKEEMWKVAAYWEFLQCRNVETARGFLLTGMRHHPESEYIYSEAIWLELKYADNLRRTAIREARRNNEEPNLSGDAIVNGALAHVMFDTAMEKLDSCRFLCTVLRIALNFENASDLQKLIKGKLMEKYSEDPKTWLALAQLELDGYTIEGEFMVAQLYKRKKHRRNLVPSKKQIIFAHDLLSNAAQSINTEEMWSEYIELFLDLLEKSEMNTIGQYPNLVKRLLKDILEAAHIQAKLSACYYKYYIASLGIDEKQVDEVLTVATDRHPKCLELWMARLKLSFSKDAKSKSQKLFQSACKEFRESDEVIELWLIMTMQFSKDETLMNDLFKLAVPVQSSAGGKVKIMHINHVYASKGLSACRALYQKLSVTPPFSLELHERMIEVEMQQSRVDAKQIRKCYEMACDQFGLKNPDLWMDYVKFELDHGSKTLITGIYTRASKTLESAHSETFMQMYSNLQTSIL